MPTALPVHPALYRELLARSGGRRVLLAPKMRVLDSLEPTMMPGLTQQERDYAFRAHFDLVLVGEDSFKPVAAVELVCGKAGLPLVRVRWGDWGVLEALEGVLARDEGSPARASY